MDMRAWIGLAQDMGYKLDSRFNSVWDSRFNSVRDSSSYTTMSLKHRPKRAKLHAQF